MSRTTLDRARMPADVRVHTESMTSPMPEARPRAGRSIWFWLLLACDAGVLALAATTLWQSAPVAPPADRRLSVPFADNADLWNAYRQWVVQDDGRLKPLDTLARESVRTITGRERFEGNDPVAVFVSWLMVADSGQGCDWENYPFLLCPHPELRELLFRDWHGSSATLSDEELNGKYIAPAVVRKAMRPGDGPNEKAGPAATLLLELAQRTHVDNKAQPSAQQARLLELKKRFDLYDGLRGGGVFDQNVYDRARAGDFWPLQPHPADFGAVALDDNHPGWLSLDAIRAHVRQPAYWRVTQRLRQTTSTDPSKEAQAFPIADARKIVAGMNKAQAAYRAGDETGFAAASHEWLDTLATVSQRHQPEAPAEAIALELWFHRVNPFRWAWVCGLMAGALLANSLLLGRLQPLWPRLFYWGGLCAYAASLAWAICGFVCRVTLSDRPPVSNMYESVIWVGFMTAVFGLVLEAFSRRGLLATAAALVSTLVLVLADQLPLTLNPSIQPLQAVLRSQYWLIVHVLTIVSSYAAFALAWGLGNLTLAALACGAGRPERVKAMAQCCYRAIQLGVVLLAAGTFLGGFWAAESWGRFWGWDPKEVWALIALVCYLIPLHARYVGWVRDIGMAVCAVVCFASVVMAWYGVNFVLGAGLHSYGFGGGGQAGIYLCALANICLVLHALERGKRMGRSPESAFVTIPA